MHSSAKAAERAYEMKALQVAQGFSRVGCAKFWTKLFEAVKEADKFKNIDPIEFHRETMKK